MKIDIPCIVKHKRFFLLFLNYYYYLDKEKLFFEKRHMINKLSILILITFSLLISSCWEEKEKSTDIVSHPEIKEIIKDNLSEDEEVEEPQAEEPKNEIDETIDDEALINALLESLLEETADITDWGLETQ